MLNFQGVSCFLGSFGRWSLVVGVWKEKDCRAIWINSCKSKIQIERNLPNSKSSAGGVFDLDFVVTS